MVILAVDFDLLLIMIMMLHSVLLKKLLLMVSEKLKTPLPGTVGSPNSQTQNRIHHHYSNHCPNPLPSGPDDDDDDVIELKEVHSSKTNEKEEEEEKHQIVGPISRLVRLADQAGKDKDDVGVGVDVDVDADEIVTQKGDCSSPKRHPGWYGGGADIADRQ